MQNNKNKETLEIYVLGDDFKYYENLKYLPLTSYPSNIQSALIVYSLRGTAKISVHEDVHWIQPDELIRISFSICGAIIIILRMNVMFCGYITIWE